MIVYVCVVCDFIKEEGKRVVGLSGCSGGLDKGVVVVCDGWCGWCGNLNEREVGSLCIVCVMEGKS